MKKIERKQNLESKNQEEIFQTKNQKEKSMKIWLMLPTWLKNYFRERKLVEDEIIAYLKNKTNFKGNDIISAIDQTDLGSDYVKFLKKEICKMSNLELNNRESIQIFFDDFSKQVFSRYVFEKMNEIDDK